MTKKDVQFVVLICQFHFFAKAKYKDSFREDLVDEIRSLEDIWVLLEVLGSSTSPHALDDGVDVLCQVNAKILKKCLKNLKHCSDIDTCCLYILIRAAGKHKDSHIFHEEILNRIHDSSIDVREAVAEALYDMGDIEHLKQMLEKDENKLIKELAKELLEEEEIEQVRNQLSEIMHPEFIDPWLNSRNEALDGYKPIEFIRQGKLNRIYDIIYRLRSGQLT